MLAGILVSVPVAHFERTLEDVRSQIEGIGCSWRVEAGGTKRGSKLDSGFLWISRECAGPCDGILGRHKSILIRGRPPHLPLSILIVISYVSIM